MTISGDPVNLDLINQLGLTPLPTCGQCPLFYRFFRRASLVVGCERGPMPRFVGGSNIGNRGPPKAKVTTFTLIVGCDRGPM